MIIFVCPLVRIAGSISGQSTWSRGAWLITCSARTPASILDRCITSVIVWHKALATMMISKQAAAGLEELNSLLKVTAALGHHSLVVQSSPSQT
jgi:hypothetical protein